MSALAEIEALGERRARGLVTAALLGATGPAPRADTSTDLVPLEAGTTRTPNGDLETVRITAQTPGISQQLWIAHAYGEKCGSQWEAVVAAGVALNNAIAAHEIAMRHLNTISDARPKPIPVPSKGMLKYDDDPRWTKSHKAQQEIEREAWGAKQEAEQAWKAAVAALDAAEADLMQEALEHPMQLDVHPGAYMDAVTACQQNASLRQAHETIGRLL